jgi:hypothetical protein
MRASNYIWRRLTALATILYSGKNITSNLAKGSTAGNGHVGGTTRDIDTILKNSACHTLAGAELVL